MLITIEKVTQVFLNRKDLFKKKKKCDYNLVYTTRVSDIQFPKETKERKLLYRGEEEVRGAVITLEFFL